MLFTLYGERVWRSAYNVMIGGPARKRANPGIAQRITCPALYLITRLGESPGEDNAIMTTQSKPQLIWLCSLHAIVYSSLSHFCG